MDRQDASVGVSVMPPAADPDSNANNKAKLSRHKLASQTQHVHSVLSSGPDIIYSTHDS